MTCPVFLSFANRPFIISYNQVEAKERRQRRNSELRRMAIQSAEEDLQMRKAERENKKLELLKSGVSG